MKRRCKHMVKVFLALMWGVGVLSASAHLHAQDGGKHGALLSWADAPLTLPHRSEADWLVDVGWKSAEEMYGPFTTRTYAVGERERFFPLGSGRETPRAFVLRYVSEHAYFWFEPRVAVDEEALAEAANFFEQHIWPLNASIYGQLQGAGIDGDPRMFILNQASIGLGIYGAFNPEDQCPRSLCPQSNQRDIIYLGLDEAPLGSQEYLATLAHEQQHLIQFHVDGNERRWLNEGFSQLAEHLNGFHPRYVGAGNLIEFLDAPDLQLDGWSFEDMGRHYGAAYLFTLYLYERFGLDFVRALAADPYDGLASVQHTLSALGYAEDVDAVFADWILANLLDDPFVGDGRYYYQTLDMPNPIQPSALHVDTNGWTLESSVNQYGADYYRIDEAGTYRLSFDGADSAPLLSTAPREGEWMWWSYNGSDSLARLSAHFDLRELSRATLVFDAWWQTEPNLDWWHVLVSDDGGRTWSVVGGAHAATSAPNAPGPSYSGDSSGWVSERVDLSAYAGKQIWVRFEYLTDVSITKQGLALDNLGIEELGLLDGAEEVGSVWKPEGFLRIQQRVAQHWTVALVLRGADGAATVQPLALSARNTAGATFDVPRGGEVTLVIGAMSPFAQRAARYKLALRRVE